MQTCIITPQSQLPLSQSSQFLYGDHLDIKEKFHIIQSHRTTVLNHVSNQAV